MKLPFTKEQHTKILSQMVVVGFAILFTGLIYYFGHIWGFIANVVGLATPFLLGFAIAFLLGPVLRRVEGFLKRFVFKRGDHPKLTRALGTLVSVLLFLAILAVFFGVMLPQLFRSLTQIVNYVSDFLKTHSSQINELLVKFDFLKVDGEELVVMWDNIVTSQIKNFSTILDNLVLISSTILGFFYNLLVGIITAFYLLMDKEHICALIKKLGYALCPRKRFEETIFWTRRASRIFAGFITGKIVDSLIIGVICYICMLIFHMEYPMLISLIIGVTNVIPFFGPFIGWVPGVLILLLVNPMSALWFTVFILVLQQVDGNVIGPFILGDYVGVSALSVMISIVIGSGLFGFVGMVLAVPVYALLYALVSTWVSLRLKQKNLPLRTAAYTDAPETLKPAKADEAGENA